MRTLSVSQARRLALGVQGFGGRRPSGRVDRRHFRRVMGQMGVVQLDSVNVCVRSHYVPFYARLGPFDTIALDAWLWGSRENFEYVAHEAAVTPMDRRPLWGWRMAEGRWQAGRRLEAERPDYLAAVLAEVEAHGPVSVKELSDPGERTGPWWGYGQGKLALEWLYVTGRLAIHRRNANFVTYYDVPERVVPPDVLAEPPVDRDAAIAQLALHGAAALGVGTAADIADYHRLPITEARPAVAALAAGGRLEEVEVKSWRDPAFVVPGTPMPRRVDARTLLTPFDPVVWNRSRAERLFGFEYRIEIYVPEPKRRYGYYVLPFLLGDRLVARVDLKADRPGGRLLARGAFVEQFADAVVVAGELAAELQQFAAWQGLGDIEVHRKGDLAPLLAAALG